ncbi:hypothetical protein KI387_008175, partial [Taxus chinensis]
MITTMKEAQMEGCVGEVLVEESMVTVTTKEEEVTFHEEPATTVDLQNITG